MDKQDEYNQYRRDNLKNMRHYGYPKFREKEYQYDREVFENLRHYGFEFFDKPSDRVWNIYLCVMRRARYLQNQYYVTAKEILLLHRDIIESKKSLVRSKTIKYLKNNEIKKSTKCKKCKTTQSLIVHHPDALNPYDIMTLCRSCHVKWHQENQSMPTILLGP